MPIFIYIYIRSKKRVHISFQITSVFKIRETYQRYIFKNDIYKEKSIPMIYRMRFLWRALKDSRVFEEKKCYARRGTHLFIEFLSGSIEREITLIWREIKVSPRYRVFLSYDGARIAQGNKASPSPEGLSCHLCTNAHSHTHTCTYSFYMLYASTKRQVCVYSEEFIKNDVNRPWQYCNKRMHYTRLNKCLPAILPYSTEACMRDA